MFGPIAAFIAGGAGYLGTRAASKLIEPRTVDAFEVRGRSVRIVRYHQLWPLTRQHLRYRVEEMRAGEWLNTGINDPIQDNAKARALTMLSEGPG